MERLARCVLVFVCACVLTCRASARDNIKLLNNLQNKMLLLEVISRLSDLGENNATKCYEDLKYLNSALVSRKLWAIKSE